MQENQSLILDANAQPVEQINGSSLLLPDSVASDLEKEEAAAKAKDAKRVTVTRLMMAKMFKALVGARVSKHRKGWKGHAFDRDERKAKKKQKLTAQRRNRA